MHATDTTPFVSAKNKLTKTAGVYSLLAALLLVLTLIAPLSAQAQSNYVYVHNQSAASSISAFSVSPTGTLTAVAGSPYSTGGAGATTNCFGLDQMTISAASNLLFVANGGDQTISVFSINPASGALTAAPGSPVASGLTLDSCGGISVAATPDGKYLMASANGQIQTYSVAASGALTAGSLAIGLPAPMVGLKISANGSYLASANGTGVAMMSINLDGSLTPVAGSPFPAGGTGSLAGLDFNSCSSTRLFGGEASLDAAISDAWTVSASGSLTAAPGSPYVSAPGGALAGSSLVMLSSDNATLFESDQLTNNIRSFSVQADGSLSSISTFDGLRSLHTPVGMASDASGALLYVADDLFGVAVLSINADGSLSALTDNAIDQANEIQGVAAYPARTCTSGDLDLTTIPMTAAPSPVGPSANITYTITVINNGPGATSANIVDNLPDSTSFVSCAATGGGVCGTVPGVIAPNRR